MQLFRSDRIVKGVGIALVCMVSTAVAETLLDRLPPFVGEITWPATITAGERADIQVGDGVVRWNYKGDGSVSDALLLDPRVAGGEAERFRFRVRGGGSNDRLVFMAYHAPSDRWIDQGEVPLYYTSWRHLEFPANNNFHHFHETITQLALVVRPGSGSPGGWLEVKDAVLAAPHLLEEPIAERERPAPVFVTWGGANPDQLRAAAAMGLNLHLTPIRYPEIGRPVEERVQQVIEMAPVMKELGVLSGMHFFSQASQEFTEKKLEWFTQFASGERYTRPGGNFLSPWHPDARAYFAAHMHESLEALRDAGTLDQVEVVFLSPGEEGEVSYMWNDVHAFDPYAIAAYRDYLRAMYDGDIDRLNADWESGHASFDDVLPPSGYVPDRQHWVFTEFYRYSMLAQCVFLADQVLAHFEPDYFLWMPHSIGGYPHRFYTARYPYFYVEQLMRLGVMDVAHIAALNWQEVEDVESLNNLGVVTVGEVDVVPTKDRLQWTFDQSRKFGFHGVFVGAADVFVERVNDGYDFIGRGTLARELITEYKDWWNERHGAGD